MKTTLYLLAIMLSFILFSCSDKPTEVNDFVTQTPVFNQLDGVYLAPMQLEMFCATDSAEIHYTTNGTSPNVTSPLYTAPITLDSTATVKARAFRSGYYPSAILSRTYTLYIPTMADLRKISGMEAAPDSVYADNGTTTAEISLYVKDGNNNPVEGQNVQFSTTLGNLIQNVFTDSTGKAVTTFWGQSVEGIATIRAIVRNYSTEYTGLMVAADTAEVSVTILPPLAQTVHSLQFIQSGQIDLNVYNTNGVNSCQLRVRLLDEDMNLVTEQRQVWFHILNAHPPYGATLNGTTLWDSLWTFSENGIAQMVIYSGTIPETLSVRISCTDAGHCITAEKDNIVVHAGPPYRIEVFAGGDNSGEDLSGGLWRIIVGAHVYDLYDNPVDYGTSVWFFIPNNEYNCQIGANAYVGNESVYGDSTAGTAYTTLVYNGVFTGYAVTIRAVCGGYNGQEVIGQADIVLPLNGPVLDMHITPGNIAFHGNTNSIPISAPSQVLVNVYDGQGCPIRYAAVALTATCGTFEYTQGTNTDPEHYNPVDTPNVIITDTGGQAIGILRSYAADVPPDDPMDNCASILSVRITASLPVADTSLLGFLTLIKYAT